MMLRIAIAVMFAALVLLALAYSRADAAEYPTVREIENALHCPFPCTSAQLPLQVNAGGRVWNMFYLRGKAAGRGRYNVEIKLQ